MSAPVLEVKDLFVEYVTPAGPVSAVDGVSFSIAAGEVFGLAGESGCGKSTIAHSLLRVLRSPAVITGGSIRVAAGDVLEMDAKTLQAFRWKGAAMVFQSAMNSLNPVLRIRDQIADAIRAHDGGTKKAAYVRAAGLLQLVGIDPGRARSYPHELSGGMRQRVVIAIALALQPDLLIMDEPTTALDVVVQRDILQQIARLKREMGFAILFITHDLSLMIEFSDRIGIMYAGRLVELGSAKDLFHGPRHPYTKGLLASFPALTGPKVKMTGIPGSPPNLATPPAGCRFHPRCPVAVAQCATVTPPLRDIGGRQVACHLEGGPQ